MARQYKRDARGRFASGGGSGSSRPARKAAPTRAGNRLNRDNSGRITGIGRDGATARGGRLKTASGGRRATQTASLKSPGFRGGTIAKGGRGVSGSVARSLAAVKRGRAKPSAPRQKRPVTGADLARRFERISPPTGIGGNGRVSATTIRERQLRRNTDPSQRTKLQRQLDRARATEARALGFRNAVAGVRALGYRGRVATPEGQRAMAVNYQKRPRYSTRQRIRPTWNTTFA